MIVENVMHNTWRTVEPAKLAEIAASTRAKIVRPMGKPDPVDPPKQPIGRPKVGEGFRARAVAKARAKRAGKLILSERQVLRACMEVLEAHPHVALWWRQNTGGFSDRRGQYVKFSFKGAPDLMAVLKGGRFLACECKSTGKHASPEQGAFLDNVVDCGGAAVVADDAGKLKSWLDLQTGSANGAQDGREGGQTGKSGAQDETARIAIPEKRASLRPS